MKFRIIPITIFILFVALADRVADVFGISWVQDSYASTPAPKAEGKAEAKKEDKPAEKPAFSTVKPAEGVDVYTASEKEVLEKLSARREQLEKWAAELEMKQKLIDVSSQKLDSKLEELKLVKADAEVLLKQYNEHEDAKIRSLVKIYEGMKPKDAASIFNDMEMSIALEIIDKMSERKVAPVIAAMDVKRARKITEELAMQRSLKEAQGKRNMDLSNIDAPNTQPMQ